MRNSLFRGVGKREMRAFAAESRGKLCCLAVKLQNWTLSGQPKHLHVLPGYAVAKPVPMAFIPASLAAKRAARRPRRWAYPCSSGARRE